MLEWFIRFPEFAEFTEFNKNSAPFRKKLHCVSRRKDYIYLLDLDPIVNQTGGFFLVEMLPVIIYGTEIQWIRRIQGIW